MGQDVALDVDPGRDLDQLEPGGRQAEDAAFGDVEHGLARLGGDLAAEGDLLDLGAEFLRRPSCTMRSCAVLGPDAAGRRR